MTNDEQKIIIKDYQLESNDQILVAIDQLKLATGNYYAITGDSGCSKTTTLINFKKDLFSKSLASKISISLVNDQPAKIKFINQQFDLPVKSTLIEAAYFPKIFAKLNEQQQLVDQVGELSVKLRFITNDDNHDQLNTMLTSSNYNLSGGQNKKIAVINKPDLLILDEVFVGLDPASLLIA